MMRILSPNDVIAALPYDKLVAELPQKLREATQSPQRHVHAWPHNASFLLMPAWSDTIGGIKIVNVTPGNAAKGLPAVTASYIVIDAETGEHLALLDGGELTARRTAAVAAVAASRLAVDHAHKLLLVGSGRIASELAFAYRAVRDIREVQIYSPTVANAEKLARTLCNHGFAAWACEGLEAGVRQADIIACATLSAEPLIRGEWLVAGQHVSLIGGFTHDMREADDTAMARADVWVDSMAAIAEAGDLSQPIERGVMKTGDISGTLKDLCAQGAVEGREDSITLFKSVGDAAQDLATAAIALN